MISLPPGVTINYAVKIVINKLTDEMVEWYKLVGGNVSISEHYDRWGKIRKEPNVSFGYGKSSYHMQDGSTSVILHFQGKDASTAAMFLLKFAEYVTSHNLKEYEKEYV